MILMAVADADYSLISIEVGAYGLLFVLMYLKTLHFENY
jgi:hypothetical protein